MRRQVVPVVAALALGIVAFLLLRDRLPHIGDVQAALAGADGHWLAIAVAAEIFSMGMFARQQRRLLRAFGVVISLPRAGAITFGRSAIAISLPAGSALSAGFAFRQFRASGASRTTAAAVMVLSGLASFIALSGLYGLGLLAGVAIRLPATAVLGGAALFVVLIGLGLWAYRRRGNHVPRTRPTSRLSTRLRLDVAARRLRDVVRAGRAVPRRQWVLTLLAAALNWLADLLCLVAATRAFDVSIGVAQLGLIYLGVQVVRQIPLTPGGVGVIEASLLAGLMSAGAPQAAAAAAVIIYRLLSCWLIIPIGAVAWAGLRRLARRTPADQPAGAVT